jgi:tetratricopeptide (TPR) repeat protein
MKRIPIFIIILTTLACQTITQPTVVNSVGELEFAQLDIYEEELFFYQHRNPQRDDTGLAEFTRKLEVENSNPSFNRDYKGRVLGLLGMAYYLSGRTQRVEEVIAEISTTNPLEERYFILRGLLEPQQAEREKIWLEGIANSSNKGNLHLQLALLYFETGEFGKALANFDQAFFLLGAPAEEAYGELREQSFAFKDSIGIGENRQFIEEEQLTLAGMAAIVSLDGEWSRSLPQGSSYQETVQVWVGDDLLLDTRNPFLTRAQAAYFFYNILVNERVVLEGVYTNALAPGPGNFGARVESPVPDVPYRAPYFDAVLVSVEREIMELPDGINFLPEEILSGVEFFDYWESLKQEF